MTLPIRLDFAPDLVGERPLAWQDDALCAETSPETFHPRKGQSNADAKRLCASCDVREQCLEYALSMEQNPLGIWGGTSSHERRKILRERAA